MLWTPGTAKGELVHKSCALIQFSTNKCKGKLNHLGNGCGVHVVHGSDLGT